ncbi:MAG: malonyl-ACP O-methyltransferase BioC [Chlorobiaceae bacterium]|nr:malonyl-ACP O-methyltransferase BioC [Chlorobiaceae bacterium]
MSALPDKQLVCRRFGRSLETYRQSAVVQRVMASRLVGLVGRSGAPSHFDRVLEVGAGSAILTSELLASHSVGTYVANDLVPGSREFVMQAFDGRDVGEGLFLEGDIERLDPLPQGLDLVVSNATVQWLHDLGAFFERMASALLPGGLLAFSTFGAGNMREIAALEGVSLPYRTPGEIAALSGGSFETLCIEEEERRLEFVSPEAVLRHIRQTGVNGVAGCAWTRTRYQQFLHRYRTSFPFGGGVGLTYHPVYCCFRRRQS